MRTTTYFLEHLMFFLLLFFLSGCTTCPTISGNELAALDQKNPFTGEVSYIKSGYRFYYFRFYRLFDLMPPRFKVYREELILKQSVLEEAKTADRRQGVTVVLEKDQSSDRWVVLPSSEYRYKLRLKMKRINKKKTLIFFDNDERK